jgi:hypothetical protein
VGISHTITSLFPVKRGITAFWTGVIELKPMLSTASTIHAGTPADTQESFWHSAMMRVKCEMLNDLRKSVRSQDGMQESRMVVILTI